MTTNNATNTSNPVTVAQGGTGDASFTTYAVTCAGTTSTGALQSIASVGTSGQVLTSNGAGALPTFQAASGGSFVLISTQTVSGASDVHFNSFTSASYTVYAVFYRNVSAATGGVTLISQVSADGGSTWLNSGYDGVFFRYNGGGTGTDTSTANLILSEASQYANTGSGSGHMFLYLTSSATRGVVEGATMYPQTATSGALSAGVFGGYVSSTISPQPNSIKLYMSSGNISGTFSLYGIAH